MVLNPSTSSSVSSRLWIATSALTFNPRCLDSAIMSTDIWRRIADLKCARTPVVSTRARSRATATVSAASGMAGNPRTGTHFAFRGHDRYRSTKDRKNEMNTVISNVDAYCIARRISRVLCTGARALLTPTQPAALSAAISVSVSPQVPWSMHRVAGYRDLSVARRFPESYAPSPAYRLLVEYQVECRQS